MPHARLLGVQRTLFLPLIVRAHAPALCPFMDPSDAHAARMLEASGEDLRDYPMDGSTMINILWRTRLIRALGLDFFARFPHALGLNLGAGLTHYFQWLDNGHNAWLDIDLPDVVALRELLLPDAQPRCQNLAVDLSQRGWWEAMDLPGHNHPQPMFLVSEGMLMYLHPCEVKGLMQEIGCHAPEGTELLCDFISPLGIGRTVPANDHGIEDRTQFRWGAHNGQEIADLHPRLELVAQYSVSEVWGWGGSWLDLLWAPLTGGPMYGVAHLKVSDDI